MSEPRRASPPPEMDDWVAEVCRDLGLELADTRTTVNRVLDLTADVAHGVARPAAPITAFLIGLAAAGSTPPATDLDGVVADLCRRFGDRARTWRPQPPAEHPEQR